jgi:hypothetical protein
MQDGFNVSMSRLNDSIAPKFEQECDQYIWKDVRAK